MSFYILNDIKKYFSLIALKASLVANFEVFLETAAALGRGRGLEAVLDTHINSKKY